METTVLAIDYQSPTVYHEPCDLIVSSCNSNFSKNVQVRYNNVLLVQDNIKNLQEKIYALSNWSF